MAFSGSQNINQYAGINLYTPDFQLISTALTAKQQKLDTNRAKLQSYRDQLGLSLDVAKDADQKYIDDRLSQLTAMTNQYASMDLSNDGLTQSLMSNLGQVIDGNVKNAVTSTKILQSEQAEWSDKRKNKPELYDERNYEFAMQKANNWMNDDTVGTAYNGGGGFIEYVDVDKIISDRMKDLDKQLRKTYMRSAEAGAIDAIETVEEVRRSDVEKAIRNTLTGKAAQQVDINAWSAYKNQPEEMLRTDWDNYTTSKIGVIDSELETYEAMLKTETDSTKRSQIKKAIANTKEVKESWDETDFDTALTKFGKQGVYTKLHTENWLENYLDVYSEAPHVVKREADDVQKANLAHQLDLEKFAETKRHNLTTENNALLKAQGKTSKSGAGTSDYGGGFIDEAGSSIKVAGPKAKEELAKGQERAAVYSRDKVLTQFKQEGLDDTEAEGLLRSPAFVAYIKRGVFTKPFKGEINSKSRTIQLKPETLNDYREAFVSPPKVKKQAFSTIDQMIDVAHKNIAKGIKTGDAGAEGLPKFNFVLKYDGDKEHFKIVNQSKDHNRYSTLLLRKQAGKALSSAEKKELELYSNIHLLMDPNLRNSDRNIIRQKIVGQGLENVDYRTSKDLIEQVYLKKNKGYIPGTYTQLNYASSTGRRDRYISEFTTGDVKSMDMKSPTINIEGVGVGLNPELLGGLIKREKDIRQQDIEGGFLNTVGNWNRRPQYTDQQLASIEKAYNTYLTKTKPAESPENMLKAGFDNIHRSLDDYYKPSLPSYSKGRMVYDLDKAKYKETAALLGFDKSSNNYDIVASPEINQETGKPTGMIVFSRKSDVKAKSEDTSGIPMEEAPRKLTYEQAKKAGILAIGDTDISDKYDARNPDKARTVNLGNGSRPDVDFPKPLSDMKSTYLFQSADSFSKSTGDATARVIQKFNGGAFEFKLIPEGKNYYFQAFEGGKPALGGAKVPVGEYLSPAILNRWQTKTDEEVDTYFPALVQQYQQLYSTQELTQ